MKGTPPKRGFFVINSAEEGVDFFINSGLRRLFTAWPVYCPDISTSTIGIVEY